MKRFIFSLAIVAFFSCKSQPENSLKGVWKVNEIHWITRDTTYSINNAQPGVFMVSDSKYSFIWTPTREMRIPFKKLAQPTLEEMINGFQSIVLNAGSYMKTDSTFMIKAVVAKVPGFEGGEQTFNYKIDKNRLELKMIDETYPNGEKPNWFGKMETLFIMSKID